MVNNIYKNINKLNYINKTLIASISSEDIINSNCLEN